MTIFDDPASELVLGTVPARVPMADIYRGIDFSAYVPPPAIEPGAE